jgi:hypothetical protein
MSYFEIAIYGMAVDDQGVHTLAEAIYEPIAFYDVIVTRRYDDNDENYGHVDIVEEHEELDEKTAWTLFQQMQDKYPGADIVY